MNDAFLPRINRFLACERLNVKRVSMRNYGPVKLVSPYVSPDSAGYLNNFLTSRDINRNVGDFYTLLLGQHTNFKGH